VGSAPVSINQLASKSIVSTKQGVSLGASGLALVTSSNPIGAVLTGVGALANLFKNNPHGAAATDSKTLAEFISKWKHSIPANLVPIWDGGFWGGPKQDRWLICNGASGGLPPNGGCKPLDNGQQCISGQLYDAAGNPIVPGGKGCTGGGCKGECLPVGTVETLYGGGVRLATDTAMPTAPLPSSALGAGGTVNSQGQVVPWTDQTVPTALQQGILSLPLSQRPGVPTLGTAPVCPPANTAGGVAASCGQNPTGVNAGLTQWLLIGGAAFVGVLALIMVLGRR